MLDDELVNDGVEFTGHNLGKAVKCQVNPVICNPAVREVVGANLLGTITAANQVPTSFSLFAGLFGQRLIHQLRLKQTHGTRFVLVLRTLILTFDDDTFLELSKDAEVLAKLEGLHGHAAASEYRRRNIVGE